MLLALFGFPVFPSHYYKIDDGWTIFWTGHSRATREEIGPEDGGYLAAQIRNNAYLMYDYEITDFKRISFEYGNLFTADFSTAQLFIM